LLLHEASGVVMSVGDGVSHLQPGDVVALNPAVSTGRGRATLLGAHHLDPDLAFCSIDWHGFSRRYVLHPAENAVSVSKSVGLEIAALVEPMACALRACDHAKLVGIQESAREHGYDEAFGSRYIPSVLVIGGGALGSMVAVCAASKSIGAKVTVITRKRESQQWIEGLRIPGVNTCLVEDATDAALMELNRQNGEHDGAFDAMIVCTPQAQEFSHYQKVLRRESPQIVIAGGSNDSISTHARPLMIAEATLSFSRRYTPSVFARAALMVTEESDVLSRLIAEVECPDEANRLMLDVWKGFKGKAQIKYL
jgi:threonine dehydrogenase-like Zn-dependent dehydrogenase